MYVAIVPKGKEYQPIRNICRHFGVPVVASVEYPEDDPTGSWFLRFEPLTVNEVIYTLACKQLLYADAVWQDLGSFAVSVPCIHTKQGKYGDILVIAAPIQFSEATGMRNDMGDMLTRSSFGYRAIRIPKEYALMVIDELKLYGDWQF